MKGRLRLGQVLGLVSSAVALVSSSGCRSPEDAPGGGPSVPLPSLTSPELTVGITVDCPYGLAG